MTMSRLLLLTASMMWFSTLKKMVGKGRDVGLNQITLFEGKVAGGNGEQVNLVGMFLGFCVQIRFGVHLWLYFREETSWVWLIISFLDHSVKILQNFGSSCLYL
ncbi:uncharacterized protein LOC131253170 [Magnolia sinica]|uniref:uncharacterized protein LOC131253170 n=1 Tax=Magnolia sinica TaxID=86752 RepID=UPI0026584671|nr:uncharacterized protein LOC131253170 [Magnolia sinica]